MSARRRIPGLATLLVLAFLGTGAACDGGEGALEPVALPVSVGSRLAVIRSWDVGFRSDGTPVAEMVVGRGELPKDLLSLTLVATSNEESVPMAFDVKDINGEPLVEAEQSEWSPNRALSARGLAVAMLPSASGPSRVWPNVSVAVRFKERPSIAGPPQVTVTAYAKRPASDGGGMPEAQELPVVLVMIGERPHEGSALDRAFHDVQEIWASAGIAIRREATVRLTGSEYEIFERLSLESSLGSDSPELGSLLALSARVETAVERPLFLFMVPEIVVSGAGASVWAVAGGIPTPPAAGTVRSGVAVNFEAVEHDPVFAGQIMAHEIGHALGLYHTTEGRWVSREDGVPEAPVHDQIDDTAECPPEADKSADHRLAPDECGAHDAGNLMFWVGTRGARTLTPGQAAIARRSALAR